MLPKHITLHVARMRLTQVEANSTLRIVQEIETESRKLADVDVDVIVFAATAPSSRNGIGYDRELIARIEAASGKPATTASTALLEALRALSAKTIVLGAPWSDAINRTTAAFIEANGFSVVAQEALGLVDNLDIGLLDPQTAYDVGRRIYQAGSRRCHVGLRQLEHVCHHRPAGARFAASRYSRRTKSACGMR